MSQHHRNPAVAKSLREARPRIEASLPQPCQRCGRPIMRGDLWDAGHIIPIAKQVAAYGRVIDHRVGPECIRCNRRAGGRDGARKVHKRKRLPTVTPSDDLRLPNW